MTFEGRQWLYRIFWWLSEMVVVEREINSKRAVLGAMFLVEELRTKGRVSSCESRRQLPTL